MQSEESTPTKHPAVKHKLTASQKEMYASESLQNFRFVYTLLARPFPSHTTLTSSHRVSDSLQRELGEMAVWAELAYGWMDVRWLLAEGMGRVEDSLRMGEEGIVHDWSVPVENDTSLRDVPALTNAKCLATLVGSVAGIKSLVGYREGSTKQLIVGISGTQTGVQALYDVDARMHYPAHFPDAKEKFGVHQGFWSIHKGSVGPIMQAVKDALQKYEVDELVVTGMCISFQYFKTKLTHTQDTL